MRFPEYYRKKNLKWNYTLIEHLRQHQIGKQYIVCYMSPNSNIYHFPIPSFLLACHAYICQSTLATARSYLSHHLYYPQIYVNINREVILYVTKFQYYTCTGTMLLCKINRVFLEERRKIFCRPSHGNLFVLYNKLFFHPLTPIGVPDMRWMGGNTWQWERTSRQKCLLKVAKILCNTTEVNSKRWR
jgi:hypothetical protein